MADTRQHVIPVLRAQFSSLRPFATTEPYFPPVFLFLLTPLLLSLFSSLPRRTGDRTAKFLLREPLPHLNKI